MSAPLRLTADNGDELTMAEARAIAQLTTMGRYWPQTLTLVSVEGTLHVIRTGRPPADETAVLATISGIPNDGGAP